MKLLRRATQANGFVNKNTKGVPCKSKHVIWKGCSAEHVSAINTIDSAFDTAVFHAASIVARLRAICPSLSVQWAQFRTHGAYAKQVLLRHKSMPHKIRHSLPLWVSHQHIPTAHAHNSNLVHFGEHAQNGPGIQHVKLGPLHFGEGDIRWPNQSTLRENQAPRGHAPLPVS